MFLSCCIKPCPWRFCRTARNTPNPVARLTLKLVAKHGKFVNESRCNRDQKGWEAWLMWCSYSSLLIACRVAAQLTDLWLVLNFFAYKELKAVNSKWTWEFLNEEPGQCTGNCICGVVLSSTWLWGLFAVFPVKGCHGSLISSCEVRHWSSDESQWRCYYTAVCWYTMWFGFMKFISVGDLYSTWYFDGHRIKGSSRVNVTGLRGILTV